MNIDHRIWLGAFAVAATAALFVPACSSSSSSSSSSSGGAGSEGLVAGPKDDHCKKTVKVDPGVCHTADAGGGDAGEDAAGLDDDAGAGAGGAYGATMYNDEGDDDDCKYHVKWSARSVAKGSDATFKVVLTNKSDGSPVTGAPIDPEVYLDDTHPAPNSDPSSSEDTPGTYTVGPISFDASGKWTVRFHIHDECDDSETSPHGHAAFFVQVP